ncbi:hypothetical protein KEM48_001586 [Puccinia striiformis f. sp. tritici PST-130]|nr:hypothetical protein KEM48_001586 [Puccinia striiformis f. sp. tritici PST-130]
MLFTMYFASLLAACMAFAASSEVERRDNSGISITRGGLYGSGAALGGGGDVIGRVHARRATAESPDITRGGFSGSGPTLRGSGDVIGTVHARPALVQFPKVERRDNSGISIDGHNSSGSGAILGGGAPIDPHLRRAPAASLKFVRRGTSGISLGALSAGGPILQVGSQPILKAGGDPLRKRTYRASRPRPIKVGGEPVLKGLLHARRDPASSGISLGGLSGSAPIVQVGPGPIKVGGEPVLKGLLHARRDPASSGISLGGLSGSGPIVQVGPGPIKVGGEPVLKGLLHARRDRANSGISLGGLTGKSLGFFENVAYETMGGRCHTIMPRGLVSGQAKLLRGTQFEGTLHLGSWAIVHWKTMDELSTGSESDYANSWVTWFLSTKGNEYFCEVDEEYILDRFNLTGLNSEVHRYGMALDLITDAFGVEELDEATRESVEGAARHLYGLIHARYIITSRGLAKMLDKYKKADFGRCPRVLCNTQPLLPVGLSDTPYSKAVKLYCPRCEDIYSPKSSRHGTIDGAYFGTTFPHMLFMVYPNMVPTKLWRLGTISNSTTNNQNQNQNQNQSNGPPGSEVGQMIVLLLIILVKLVAWIVLLKLNVINLESSVSKFIKSLNYRDGKKVSETSKSID